MRIVCPIVPKMLDETQPGELLSFTIADGTAIAVKLLTMGNGVPVLAVLRGDDEHSDPHVECASYYDVTHKITGFAPDFVGFLKDS